MPTQLKLLTGNRGKRPLNLREPKPKAGAPSCPIWLDLEAKQEWKRVVPELARLGLLVTIDRGALAGYCQAWSDFHESKHELDAEGRTITTDKGFKINHPAVSRMNAALKNMRAFSTLLGLSPSDRARLKTPKADAEDDALEAFLRKAK